MDLKTYAALEPLDAEDVAALAASGRCDDCCYDALAGIDSGHCRPCTSEACDGRYTDPDVDTLCTACRAEVDNDGAYFAGVFGAAVRNGHLSGRAYVESLKDAGRGAQVAL